MPEEKENGFVPEFHATVATGGLRHPRKGLTSLVLAVVIASGWLVTPAAMSASTVPPSPGRALAIHTQTETSSPAPATDEATLSLCLMREWRHSHEENTDEIVVYRPADYPFPPSRGRIGYEFLAAGYLVYHGIAPADGETVSPGRWELLSDRRVRIEINEPESPRRLETLLIASCSEERLEIVRQD